MKNRKIISIVIICLGLLFIGWGATGHSIINFSVGIQLPPSMARIAQMDTLFRDHASDADNRKNADPSESPKHFIDIDAYPEFASHSLTHNLNSLIAEYGNTIVTKNGTLPWAIATTTDSLTRQMSRGDWSKAWLTASDLGHYIGDAHQPLHCTQYYDGYSALYPSSNGLHSRYETGMLRTYAQQISIVPSQVHYVANPLDSAFSIIYQSNVLVDSLYIADQYARTTSGSNSSTQYYSLLWLGVDSITVRQFQRASEQFANYLYTAWVNAGSPTVTSVQLSSQDMPSEVILAQNYPNPFNPTTTILFTLTHPSTIELSLFDISGKRITTLVKGRRNAGNNSIILDASKLNLPSGIYLYRLSIQESASNSPMVYSRKMLFMK